MTTPSRIASRIRVAVVAADPTQRQAFTAALQVHPDLDVKAWADAPEPLIVLGTHADVCLCAVQPSVQEAAQLRDLGCTVVVDRGDPVAAVRGARAPAPAAAVRRPALSARQRDVLIAYVSSSDLLPTLARRLGMDPETMKTHLRRIRAKYIEVGRPAPTRRDLYVRAVEDGYLPPPSHRSRQL